MDNLVKQRVIGAVVLVALAVIFVPMLLEHPEDELGPVGSNLPAKPDQNVQDRIEPLTLPEPPPESEPAQVVLDQPPADNAAAGDAAMAEAVQQSDQSAPAATAEPEPTESAPAPAPVEPSPIITPPVATPPAITPAPTPAPAVPSSAAKPAPAPSKVLSGWVVQLAALSNKDNALALRERLRALGYTAFVEEIKTAQGVQYRVRVGPELERTNADNLRNRLEEQVKIKGIVMRYP